MVNALCLVVTCVSCWLMQLFPGASHFVIPKLDKRCYVYDVPPRSRCGFSQSSDSLLIRLEIWIRQLRTTLFLP